MSARKTEVKKTFRITDVNLKGRKYYPRKYYRGKGWIFVVEWQKNTAVIITVHNGKGSGVWKSIKFYSKKYRRRRKAWR